MLQLLLLIQLLLFWEPLPKAFENDSTDRCSQAAAAAPGAVASVSKSLCYPHLGILIRYLGQWMTFKGPLGLGFRSGAR